VLQDRTYEVLGDSRPRRLDLRVVAATNKNLAELVAQGRFREDLFYRLNLITLHLPALRERPQDIPALAQHFIRQLQATYQRPGLRLGAAAAHYLQGQPLPGNIRELKNLVERAALTSPNDELTPADFQPGSALIHPSTSSPPPGTQTLEALEEQAIRQSVAQHRGNLSQVARALGLSRGALYRRLEKFGIPTEE